MKYAWITQHRGSFPVAVMCVVLNVSPSGYYDSIDRPPSARAERHERIQQAVQQAHAESHGIYGSYKVAEVRTWSRLVATRWRWQCVKWA